MSVVKEVCGHTKLAITYYSLSQGWGSMVSHELMGICSARASSPIASQGGTVVSVTCLRVSVVGHPRHSSAGFSDTVMLLWNVCAASISARLRGKRLPLLCLPATNGCLFSRGCESKRHAKDRKTLSQVELECGTGVRQSCFSHRISDLLKEMIIHCTTVSTEL